MQTSKISATSKKHKPESNIGLNAICQYTYTKKNPLPQGLGTGALFTNNFETHLQLEGDQMWHKK